MRWWRWTVVAAVAVVAPGCALFRRAPAPPPVTGGVQVGEASWYGPGFHGRPTASGEIFDQHALTAAHPSLPLGTRARITSLTNNRSVEVRINDRGPFVGGRIVDLSYAAACRIDMIRPGVMPVRLEVLGAPARRTATRPTRPPLAAPRGAPARPAGAAPAKASRSTPNRQRHDHAAGEPAATRAAARYLVELGAYRERHAADAAQREVARRFPEARVTEPDAGDTYRVQLGPYAARRSAEARAQVLERLGYAASVVPAP